MQITKDTVALVTGGASGLGLATAARFADLGAHVAILDRDSAGGKAAARELDGMFIEADVIEAASVRKAIDGVITTLGPPRVVVNCAGIAPAAKTVSRGAAHDPDLFQTVMSVNLTGCFLVASMAAEHMVLADPMEGGERGVIINTASIAAFDGQIGQIAYAASKGGVAAMTLPMSRDLAQSGVRVVAIAPGIFETPMVAGLSEDIRASLGQQVPFPSRLGRPSEFAAFAQHIVENPMLNGEVIRLDGAIRMGPR